MGLKEQLSTLVLVGLVAFVVALLLSMGGCALTEKELVAQVKGDIWLHEKLPDVICNREPELKRIGVYRVITCTATARDRGLCKKDDKTYEEFVSYCNVAVEKHLAMHQKQFDQWIEKLRIALKK